jgi:hypothetical protein
VGKSEGSGTTQLERNCSARRMPKVIVVLSFPLIEIWHLSRKFFYRSLLSQGIEQKMGLFSTE